MSTLRATNFQHASAANPALVLAADGSATANVSAINGGPLAGFRNAIINGNFDIWQRGTSFTANGYGGADRWAVTATGSTHSTSRQAFTLGQTSVPNEPTWFHRTVVASVAGSSNQALMYQCIEDVRTFAGQQVTISFWAKADATKNIAFELTQNFGTGGSPSAEVIGIGTVKKSLTTSWQKITHTVSVPSISGKTLGSNGDNKLLLLVWFDAGSSFNSRTDTLGQQSGTFDIAQVQVEPGPVATTFERRPIGTELALCQRYYISRAHSAPWRKYVVNVHREFVPFPVPMRTSPTLTKATTTPINLGTDSTGAGKEGLTLDFQFTAGGTGAIDIAFYEVNASAEL